MDLKERKLNRLAGFDYSNGGYYFVTICTKNRINCFGNIVNEQMMLNAYGQIVEQQWTWLQKQYKYVSLDEYIIMPNHMHGIVVIDRSVGNGRDHSGGNSRDHSTENSDHSVGNSRDHSLGNSRDCSLRREKIKSLSELIGAFKTTSSKLIHRIGLNRFEWQKSFYDHIIRNEISLFNIRKYIKNNPIKWESDRYYK